MNYKRISFNHRDAEMLISALEDHYCEVNNMPDDNSEYLSDLKALGERLSKFIGKQSHPKQFLISKP